MTLFRRCVFVGDVSEKLLNVWQTVYTLIGFRFLIGRCFLRRLSLSTLLFSGMFVRKGKYGTLKLSDSQARENSANPDHMHFDQGLLCLPLIKQFSDVLLGRWLWWGKDLLCLQQVGEGVRFLLSSRSSDIVNASVHPSV